MKSSLFALSCVLLASAILPASLPASPATRLLNQDGHKHDAAEFHKLGRKTIGGYTVSVVLIGEAHAGESVKVDIKLIDAKTEPKALRVWFGEQNVDAKNKTALTKGEKTYAATIQVPAGTPEKGPVWVELETDTGVQAASYDIIGHEGHKH